MGRAAAASRLPPAAPRPPPCPPSAAPARLPVPLRRSLQRRKCAKDVSVCVCVRVRVCALRGCGGSPFAAGVCECESASRKFCLLGEQCGRSRPGNRVSGRDSRGPLSPLLHTRRRAAFRGSLCLPPPRPPPASSSQDSGEPTVEKHPRPLSYSSVNSPPGFINVLDHGGPVSSRRAVLPRPTGTAATDRHCHHRPALP